MSNKKTRDFVYHSAKFRGLTETDAVALAKHLADYLVPKPTPNITSTDGVGGEVSPQPLNRKEGKQ